MIRTRAAAAAAVSVAQHPELWVTAVKQLAVLAPQNWYRQWPPLPIPDDDYLRFRFETAYGDGSADPSEADVISYLKWCRHSA